MRLGSELFKDLNIYDFYLLFWYSLYGLEIKELEIMCNRMKELFLR